MFQLLESGGRVLVSGPTDSGKSTFCLALADACAVRGHLCAVVDADTGQSEIGPPGTVGLACLNKTTGSFAELEPDAIYFVGSTSPPGHLLPLALGVGVLCRFAGARRPHLTIVDMPGFVSGPGASTLVSSVISESAPDTLVIFQRERSMRDILAAVRGLRKPEVLFLEPSAQARQRSAHERTARRRLKFAAYFADAETFELQGRSCGLPYGGPFAGRALPIDDCLALESVLGVEVVYAEESALRTLIVTRTEASPAAVASVARSIRGRAYTCVTQDWFRNSLVGLADDSGRHHAVGILEEVDFRSEQLRICSPLKRPGIVRQVLLGALRLTRDGRELGYIAPGSLYSPSGAGVRRRR
ncbi:MAG: hypothetical protein IT209_10190 [Armatimonadetes bacterium]|nr:hypothetical protein [Armatimonadota bacterium]